MGTCDLIIRAGLVYDGSGGDPLEGDVAVEDGRIVAVSDLAGLKGREEVQAAGLAVTPGFINVLSWATESILEDGRCQSDVRQGVTLEVFGEGESMGPLSDALRDELRERQQGIYYDVEWTTLGEYLEHLEIRGMAPNVASFVGATTVRANVIGYEDRAPSADELERMRTLVRQAMREGALGVGASLIYAPACYAATEELVELARVAAESDGMFISHLRSEADRLLEAVDELIEIAESAGIRAEIYHLKAAGRSNWDKLDEVISRVERARAQGLAVTADMYPYTAAATGLDASMPPWVQEGGFAAWRERLGDAAIRDRVEHEMLSTDGGWENFFRAAGPEQMRLVRFRSETLRRFTGWTLLDVSRELGVSPAQAAMQLVREDDSRVETAYFFMSEENVRKQLALPWMSFASDAMAMAPEGVFLGWSPHPRAYGTFARVLGKYVRDEGVIPLTEAVRRLTSLPAGNLRLLDRGRLSPGYAADVAIFDPDAIGDTATYDNPHRYAEGMVHVLVNGTPVLLDGEPTAALPGKALRGPGWRPSGN